MSKYLLFVAIIFTRFTVFAETIKTNVLVIGGTYSGVAAAMQCAHSRVKTLLIEPSGILGGLELSKSTILFSQNAKLPFGFWGDFRKKIQAQYTNIKPVDTLYAAPLKFTPAMAVMALKQMTDTLKQLTIQLNTQWTSIRKDGTGWDVTVTHNGKAETIKAQVLIDATGTGKAAIKAGAIFITDADHPDSTGRQLQGLVHLRLDAVYAPYANSKTYRTAIAVNGCVASGKTLPAFNIPLGAVVAKDVENVLVTGPVISADYAINRSLDNPSAQILLGQGAGTIAAYCAFYETTTHQLNVRAIQGELLDFKGCLLPFADVRPNDLGFRAIQQIGATGLLQGVIKGHQIYYVPDSVVTTAEIKPVLTETYTRAFLWFNQHQPAAHFTLDNLISFISELTLSEQKPLTIKLQKQWKDSWHFPGDFNLSHPLTRREFAVIANQYLNPFARRVDLDGQMVN